MRNRNATVKRPARSGRTAPIAKVTVREVAALAGVSLMTVSRAVTQPDQVATATLQRVREAITKTGYVPNLAAVSLRTSQSRLVAAIVPTLKTHMFDTMLAALIEGMATQGYQVLMGQSDYSVQREDELLRTIVGRRPDGMLVIGSVHSKATRDLLAASGIPVVEAGDLIRNPVDMVVGFSHAKLGAGVCRYLAERRRTHLAVFSGDDPRAQRRNAAFVREAEKLSLPRVLVLQSPPPTSHALGRELLARLVHESPDVEAIYCSSDMLAAGVLAEAQVRGLDVPGRLAVVGTGDIEMAASLVPALTTVRVDGGRIGALAATMLMDRMAGRPVPHPVVEVGFKIVQRDSA